MKRANEPNIVWRPLKGQLANSEDPDRRMRRLIRVPTVSK